MSDSLECDGGQEQSLPEHGVCMCGGLGHAPGLEPSLAQKELMPGTAPPRVRARAARPLGARAQQPGCRRAVLGDSGAEPLAWRRYGWSVARFSRLQPPREQVRPPASVSHPLAAHTFPNPVPSQSRVPPPPRPVAPILLNPVFSIGTPDLPALPRFASLLYLLPKSCISIILPPMVPLFLSSSLHAHQKYP